MENKNMTNTVAMDKIVKILGVNGSDVIGRIVEEEIDSLLDDMEDYEMPEDKLGSDPEEVRKTALAHIYKDLAYMHLVSAMAIRLYGLNPNVLQVFIGKALDMELEKAEETNQQKAANA